MLHDMLGIFDRFTPKFVKKYAGLFPQMEAALAAYATTWPPGASRMPSTVSDGRGGVGEGGTGTPVDT